ncbi:MAG TPA: T9SS type A sorting domain-containing protein [Flavobacterium sp.]|jgi:hypothetical protein|nr:T9SS type A sorting domain-containing protein [Flavobacterium sp.]
MLKNYFKIALCLLYCTNAFSQNFNWAGSFGGVGEDVIRGMHVDAAGNVYTTGYFTDTADFDIGSGTFNLSSNGWYDIFVQKTDSNGNLVWAKQFGGGGFDLGTGISTDNAGNVFITGVFEESVDFSPGGGTLTSLGGQDIFILKLDAGGNFLWAKTVGGPGYEETTAIDTTPDGEVVLAGHFSEDADFDPGTGTSLLSSAGSNDTFLFRLSAAGNLVWAKRYGGPEIDIAMDLEVGVSGHIYLTGYFEGTADMNPNTDQAMFLTSGAEGFAAYVSHLDASGQLIYAGITHGGSVQNNNIAVDNTGNMYVVGYFSGTANFNHIASSGTNTEFTAADFFNAFVARYNADGSIAWARHISGTDTIFGFGIGVDSVGNVYTSGYFGGSADLDPSSDVFNLTKFSSSATDAFLSVLDNNGVFINAFQYGGVDFIDTHTLGVDAGNNVYVAAHFELTVDINPQPDALLNVTSSSFRDLYIIKMSGAPLNVANVQDNNVAIYPMPVRDHLYVKTKLDLSGAPYTIYDGLGRKVAAGNLSADNSIATDALSKGLYIVKLQGIDSFKVVKE